MIIARPLPNLKWGTAPIQRNDILAVPLIVPMVPVADENGQRVNSVNKPIINLFYQFPNATYVPYANPVTPIPRVDIVDQTTQVIQAGSVNRLSASALRRYLAQYLQKTLGGQPT